MPTYDNISQPSRADGIKYATNVPLTGTEADLWNQASLIPNLDPIPILYGQAIQAVVQLTPQGGPTTQNSYVVMQTDLGDGVWVDVAGCVYTNQQVPGIFVLAGGVAGNNAFQQTRQAGGFPAANFSNAMCLGGRVRFVGKAILTGGSSLSQGQVSAILATIRYKILGN